MFAALRPSGTSVPAAAATNMLMIMAAHRTRPSSGLPRVTQTTTAATRPRMTPFPHADDGLLQERFAGIAPSQLPQCDTADDDGQRLRGRVTAHPGHDRHEDRQRRNAPRWCPRTGPRTEAATKAVTRLTPSHGSRLRSDSPAGVNARSVAGDTGQPVDVLGCFILDDVNDVIDGDDADKLVLLVHNRNRQQVV